MGMETPTDEAIRRLNDLTCVSRQLSNLVRRTGLTRDAGWLQGVRFMCWLLKTELDYLNRFGSPNGE